MDEHRYAVIGAGPSGLSAARALQKAGIAFDGYEARTASAASGTSSILVDDVRVGAPHLVADDDRVHGVPDGLAMPTIRAIARCIAYFRDFADHFGLTERFRFDTRVTSLDRLEDGTGCCARPARRCDRAAYAGVILANGTLAEPNVPDFRGEFTGEILHTSAYKRHRSSPASGC